MKKFPILLIIAFVAVTAITVTYRAKHGCQNNCNINYPNYSQPTEAPNRIVSLAPNLTEILFAMGLDEKIVAVSNGSDAPAKALTKAKVGSFWQPDIEAIIAAKPDLVITLWFEQQKNIAETLERLGYKVLTLKIEKINELTEAIKLIGRATNAQQQAQQLARDLTDQLNQLQTKFNKADKTKVLWVVQTQPLRLAGRDTFVNQLIELAGGVNAIGPTIQQYPQTDTEQLTGCGAQVIIHSSMGTENVAQQQQQAELFWKDKINLPSVNNNRIHVIDSDMVLRLGPRLPQGIEMIARFLHPDIFTNKND
ncbi:ABC transporter substrate-binding protein [Planctomycetota bacterium]